MPKASTIPTNPAFAYSLLPIFIGTIPWVTTRLVHGLRQLPAVVTWSLPALRFTTTAAPPSPARATLGFQRVILGRRRSHLRPGGCAFGPADLSRRPPASGAIAFPGAEGHHHIGAALLVRLQAQK